MPIIHIPAPVQTPVLQESGLPSLAWAEWAAQFNQWSQDLDSLYAQLAALRGVRPPVIKAQGLKIDATPVTVANTTIDTILNSYTFGPRTLQPGSLLRIKAAGVYSTANGVDVVTVKYKLGGVAIHLLSTVPGARTNAPWATEWILILVTAGAGGTIETSVPYFIRDATLSPVGGSLLVSINTTIANAFALSAQWSNALIGNVIIIRQFSLELIRT